MQYEASEAATFRQALLYQPGERRGAEYKSAIRFAGDDEFSLKLLRHIQGMANAGGGWLVIGFRHGDNGLLEPDPNNSDGIAASFEPTLLANAANSSVARGQQLAVDVYMEKHRETGQIHPLISVGEFGRTPFVCRSTKSASDTGARILEEEVVYLRRPGAQTSKVNSADDWEDLIARAVIKRRAEFLGEFRGLLDAMEAGGAAKVPTAPALDAFVRDARGRLLEG